MSDMPHRTDTWIQLMLLLCTIFGAVWYVGGDLGAINQELRDINAWEQQQTQRVDDLEKEVRDLTFRARNP